jgi:hypothetical protein
MLIQDANPAAVTIYDASRAAGRCSRMNDAARAQAARLPTRTQLLAARRIRRVKNFFLHLNFHTPCG